MRVVHVTRDYPPRSTGGLSSAVGGLVASRRARGEASAVVSFDAWRSRSGAALERPTWEEEATTPILRLRPGADLKAAAESVGALGSQVVVVHCPWLWSWTQDWARGSTTVAVAHVMHQEQARRRGLDAPPASARAEAEAWTQADRIVVLTQAALPYVPAELRSRAVVAGLGVEREGAGRAELVEVQGPLALHVGRWSDSKAIDALLEAWALVHPRHPHARLALVGGLPENPRGERRWWRRRAAHVPGLLAPGWLGASALARWRDASAVAISVSPWETFGLAVAESFAHGLPVLSTPTGIALEALPAWPLGQLLPPEGPERWAAALEDALVDPIDRPSTRACAERWLDAVGDWRARAPAWDSALAPRVNR